MQISSLPTLYEDNDSNYTAVSIEPKLVHFFFKKEAGRRVSYMPRLRTKGACCVAILLSGDWRTRFTSVPLIGWQV